jgi:hypothetical protein
MAYETRRRPALAAMKSSWIELVTGALLLVFGAQWCVRWIRAFRGGTDFYGFYMAAKLARDRGWQSLYSVEGQRAELAQLFPTLSVSSYRNPPLLAALVTPLSYLTVWQGYVIWVGLMTVSWLITWRIFTAGSGRKLLGLGLVFGSLAVLEGLRLGQPIGLMAMCLAGAWKLWRTGRPFLAGLSASVLLIKPQLGFLVPVALLASANWRAVTGWALGAAIQVLLSAALMGAASLQYLAMLASQESSGAGSSGLMSAAPVEWSAISDLGSFHGGILVAVVAVAGCVGVWRSRRVAPEVALGVGVILSLVATPYGHFEDTALLLPAGFMILASRPAKWLYVWCAMAWIAVFFSVGEGYGLLALMVGILVCLPFAQFLIKGPPSSSAWPGLNFQRPAPHQ